MAERQLSGQLTTNGAEPPPRALAARPCGGGEIPLESFELRSKGRESLEERGHVHLAIAGHRGSVPRIVGLVAGVLTRGAHQMVEPGGQAIVPVGPQQYLTRISISSLNSSLIARLPSRFTLAFGYPASRRRGAMNSENI